MDWTRRLRAAVLALDGVVEAPSKFGPAARAYHVGGREFLHFHAPTLVDVRLTRPIIAALTPEERAHCVLRKAASSDWVEIRIGDEAGCVFGIEAARRAWEANQPPRAKRSRVGDKAPKPKTAKRRPTRR